MTSHPTSTHFAPITAVSVIQVKVRPNARETTLEQLPDGTYVARLKAPPVDGKANAELIALVARKFGVTRSAVVIKAGAGGRSKLVAIVDD
jgi:uncharacterized protein (TIGR00251 family)